MAHISKFIFDQVDSYTKHKNDPVMGCVQNNEACYCVQCAARCRYRGTARWEVA